MPGIYQIVGVKVMQDVRELLQQRDVLGLVAKRDGVVAGFVIYKIAPSLSRVEQSILFGSEDVRRRKSLAVLLLATLPEYQRQGVASRLLQNLAERVIGCGIMSAIVVDVRETDWPSQMLFRKCGYRATRVLRNCYSDGRDAYRFAYRAGAPAGGLQ